MGGKTTKNFVKDKNYHTKLTNVVDAIQHNEASKLKILLEDKELTSNSFEDIIYLLENSDQPLNFDNIDIIHLLLNDKRLNSSLFKTISTLIKNKCNNNSEVLELVNSYEKIIDYYKLFNQQIHQYVVIEKNKDKVKLYNNEIDYNKFKCICNNNTYNEDIIVGPTYKSLLDYIRDNPDYLFNRQKGNDLYLDNQNTTPIGYNIHLPSGTPKAVIVEVYGGHQKKDKEKKVNTPYDINEFDFYLLNKGIVVVKLNLPDLLELDVYQGKMPEDLFNKIQNCINRFYQQLVHEPEKLHKDLSKLKGLKTYLYGASFGGLVSIRHSELFPNNFDGYISHDGAISTKMMHKAEMGDAVIEDKIANIKAENHLLQKELDAMVKDAELLNNQSEKVIANKNILMQVEIINVNNKYIDLLQSKIASTAFNDYLDPADENEIAKITKPICVLQNQDDNNVHAKVATDFYKKMKKAGKADLVKLFMTITSNPATLKDPLNKGHYIPKNENEFITYCENILSFMLESSELTEVNQLEAYRLNKQTNKYYRKAKLQNEFIAEALNKFEKSFLPYKKLDLSKLTEIINEYFQTSWEKEYQPLYYGLHYSRMMTDGQHDKELKDELSRLGDLPDEMIVNVLKSQENIFYQYLEEFQEFKISSKAPFPDLSKNPQIIQLYREMLKDAKIDLKSARYLLSTFYKANPDIFLQPYYTELFSKDVNLQHDLQQANVKMVTVIHKFSSGLSMLHFINELKHVEKSNRWDEKSINNLQTVFQNIKEQLSDQNKRELNNHIYQQLKIFVNENPINIKALATLLSFAKETKSFKGLLNFTLIELLGSKLTFNNFNEINIDQFIRNIPNNAEAFKSDQGIWDNDGSMLEDARKAYVFCDKAYTDLLIDMDTWSKNYNLILYDLKNFITPDTADFIKRQVKIREVALVQQLRDIESIKEAYRDNIVTAYKVKNPYLKPESEKRITDKISSWEKELNSTQRIRNIREHFNTIFPQKASTTKEYQKQSFLPSKNISDKKASSDEGINNRMKIKKRH